MSHAIMPLNNMETQYHNIFYTRRGTQAKFTADQRPQYIYSPRELSRWVRALYEAMSPLDAMTLEEMVRLWANEALRLFHDRLVTPEEQEWCQRKVGFLPVVLCVLFELDSSIVPAPCGIFNCCALCCAPSGFVDCACTTIIGASPSGSGSVTLTLL